MLSILLRLISRLTYGTLDAVDLSGRKVTVGDVAGIKSSEAQKAFQTGAADSDSYLDVSDECDVLYVFPEDYRSKLTAKSVNIRYEPLLEKAKSVADTAIIVILASKSDEDDYKESKSKSSSSRDEGLNLFFLDSSPDFFRWSDGHEPQIDSNGMGFTDAVSFFVFGDGDPNQDFKEKRWKLGHNVDYVEETPWGVRAYANSITGPSSAFHFSRSISSAALANSITGPSSGFHCLPLRMHCFRVHYCGSISSAALGGNFAHAEETTWEVCAYVNSIAGPPPGFYCFRSISRATLKHVLLHAASSGSSISSVWRPDATHAITVTDPNLGSKGTLDMLAYILEKKQIPRLVFEKSM